MRKVGRERRHQAIVELEQAVERADLAFGLAHLKLSLVSFAVRQCIPLNPFRCVKSKPTPCCNCNRRYGSHKESLGDKPPWAPFRRQFTSSAATRPGGPRYRSAILRSR